MIGLSEILAKLNAARCPAWLPDGTLPDVLPSSGAHCCTSLVSAAQNHILPTATWVDRERTTLRTAIIWTTGGERIRWSNNARAYVLTS